MEQSTFSFLTFPGKIHYINTNQELQSIKSLLQDVKEFGFDKFMVTIKKTINKNEMLTIAVKSTFGSNFLLLTLVSFLPKLFLDSLIFFVLKITVC